MNKNTQTQNPYAVNSIINFFKLKDDSDTKLKISYLSKKILNANNNMDVNNFYNILETVLMFDKTLSSIDDFYFYKYGPSVKVELRYTFWPKKLVEYGVAKQVDAYIVREGEFFEVDIDGDKMTVKHKANPFKTDGKVIGTYARAVLANGQTVFAFANADEIEAAKRASKSKSGAVWKTWELEMSKKIPLKRLMKLIPIPTEISKAVELDNTNYKDLKDIEKDESVKNTEDAVNELNSEIERAYTIAEVLSLESIKYELIKGYVKVDIEEVTDEQANTIGLKLHPKTKDCYIAKANDKTEYKPTKKQKKDEDNDTTEDIVYEPVDQ